MYRILIVALWCSAGRLYQRDRSGNLVRPLVRPGRFFAIDATAGPR